MVNKKSVSIPNNLEEMPLETLEDYRARNAVARKLNKEAKSYLHRIIPCPVEKHPTQRVIITFTNSSMEADLPVKFSNADIDYYKKLRPNTKYDLPLVVIEHLSQRGSDVYDWKDSTTPDVHEGTKKETKVIGKNPRFAIRSVI